MLAPTVLPDRSPSLCHWCQPKNCGSWILWRDLEHRCPEKTVTPLNSGHVVGYKTWGINMLTSPMRSSWLVYRNHYMSFLAKKLLYVNECLLFPGWLWYQKCEDVFFTGEKLWYICSGCQQPIVFGLNDLYCSRFVLEYISSLLLLSFGRERSLAN